VFDTRAKVAQNAADSLAAADLRQFHSLVGFDGFIDSIIDVVDQRTGAPGSITAGYSRLATIPAFSSRCAAAAGKSTNLEIVVKEDRFGGNGPLMAGALASLGSPTTFVGCVGRDDQPRAIHPAFAELEARCLASGGAVVPVAPPARTYALEFDDGKLMLNDPRSVQQLTWPHLKTTVGLDVLTGMCRASRLLGIVNWTNMSSVREIIRGFTGEVLSHMVIRLEREPTSPERLRAFIDLSDPARRTDSDIAGVLEAITEMDAIADLTLGLNLAEAERIDRVCGVGALSPGDAPQTGRHLQHAAQRLREHLRVDTVVIHPREGAAAANTKTSNWFEGPLCARPRLSTGAGDHFNAGFALAQVLRMPLDQCCATGAAVSGLYVREGQSPNRDRLLSFLRSLPQPEC
jgi:sugar/nucleoside kinase (ribokinase family)